MKFEFDDGSFVSFIPSNNDPTKLDMVMCGVKGTSGDTIMASSELELKQVVEITKFLVDWVEKLETD